MYRGKTFFKCTECGHLFVAPDIELSATTLSVPQRCPKCESIRTRPAIPLGGLLQNKKILHIKKYAAAVIVLLMNMLLFASCGSADKEARWRTTTNGIKIFYADTEHSGWDDVTYEWAGPVNPDSLAHGKGTLIVRSEDEGETRKDIFAFYGNLAYQPQQSCYFGDYNSDHQSDGFGVRVEGPRVSVGDFEDGKGRGKVHVYFNDALVYDGAWKDSQYNGYGTLYSAGGNLLYYGEWKNGKQHGEGTMVDEKGLKYLHIWKDGELKESTKELYAKLNSHAQELTADQYAHLRWRYFLYEKYHVALYVVVSLLLVIMGYVFLRIYNKNDKNKYNHKDPIEPKSIYPYWIYGGLFGLHRAKLLSNVGILEFTLTATAILMNTQNIFLFIDRPGVWGMLWQMSIVNILVCVAAISIWIIDFFLIPYQVYVLTSKYYRRSIFEMDILAGKATELEEFCHTLPEKFVDRDTNMEKLIRQAVQVNNEKKEVGKISKFFGGDIDFAQEKFDKLEEVYEQAETICTDTNLDAWTLEDYLKQARLEAYKNLLLAKDLIKIIKANSKGKAQEVQQDKNLDFEVEKVDVHTEVAQYNSMESMVNTLANFEKTFTSLQKNGFGSKTSVAIAGVEAAAGILNIIADRQATRERLAEESLKIVHNIKLTAEQLTKAKANILRAHELLLALFNANKAFIHAYTGLRDQVYGDISFKSYCNGPLHDRSILESKEFMASLQHLAMVCSEYNKINQNKIE